MIQIIVEISKVCHFTDLRQTQRKLDPIYVSLLISSCLCLMETRGLVKVDGEVDGAKTSTVLKENGDRFETLNIQPELQCSGVLDGPVHVQTYMR